MGRDHNFWMSSGEDSWRGVAVVSVRLGALLALHQKILSVHRVRRQPVVPPGKHRKS